MCSNFSADRRGGWTSTRTTLLLVLLGALIAATGAQGQVLWQSNGVPVCLASGEQTRHCVVTDGAGGTVIGWEDLRTAGNKDVYAQRLDGLGNPLWNSNGVRLSIRPNTQDNLRLTSDPYGHVFATWQDYGGTGNLPDAFVQLIDLAGNRLWSDTGMLVARNGGYQCYWPDIAPDGLGGVVLAWEDWVNREGVLLDPYPSIFASRLDQNGTALWGTQGMSLAAVSYRYSVRPRVIADGTGGGMYACWTRAEAKPAAGRKTTLVGRIESAGTVQWIIDPSGGGLSTYRDSARMVSDGGSGCIVAWQDKRAGNWDIYAQRLDQFGSLKWGSTGKSVASTSDHEMYPQLCSDDAGGAIICWWDSLAGDIWAQRVDVFGNLKWGGPGVPVCTTAQVQSEPNIVENGSGGCYIVWTDERTGLKDIYCQMLDSTGNPYFVQNGIPVCTASSDQLTPRVCGDGSGGAICAWVDYRNGNADIYAQRVNGTEGAPPPPPQITDLVDPGTGSDLVLKWTQPNLTGITDFSIEWGTAPGVYDSGRDTVLVGAGGPYRKRISTGLVEHTPYYVGIRAHNAASGLYSAYAIRGPVTPNIPVVLVHGWKGGNPGTWTNYRSWLTASGFANIWIPALNSCGPEGEDQFDKNAQILATYILEQREALRLSTGIQATEINIVAHSMGGLVSRRLIADQSSFGMNSINVRSLTMLGTPNGGTLYANAACFPVCELSDWRIRCDENLGHLVCWGPATCELSSLNMQSFNAKYSPTATDLAHFYAVAGTACCGLKRCKWSCSITGEAYNHDGVVAVASVFGIPILPNHRYLRNVKHEDLPKNKPDVFDQIVLPILMGNSPASDVLVASSDSDSSTSQIVYAAALPTDSVLWVEDTLALHNVSLATFWASGLSAEPEMELVPPGGGVIDSTSALVDTANNEYSHGSGIVALTVLNPADGDWIIRLRTHEWQDSVSIARVSVEVLSDVQLTLFNYLPIGERSDSVVLHAKLAEGAIPVSGASVEIRAIRGSHTLPWIVSLPDDGLGMDSVAGDGIYSGSFIQTQGTGVYTFMCNASGLTSQAIPFSRVAFLQTYITDVGRGDMNHDGFYDVFDVVMLIDYVFSGALPPYPDFIADANCDGYPDVFDIAHVIDYIFSGGPIPGCP